MHVPRPRNYCKGFFQNPAPTIPTAMKQQRLSITVVDHRKPEGDPDRTRTLRFSRHQDYLRAIGREQKAARLAGLDTSESTDTVLHLLPPSQQSLL